MSPIITTLCQAKTAMRAARQKILPPLTQFTKISFKSRPERFFLWRWLFALSFNRLFVNLFLRFLYCHSYIFAALFLNLVIRSSSGGWVLNNFEKKPGFSGLFMNKLAVEELCFRIGLPYCRNFSSALAKPSVSRVNNTPEASAKYSRCRLTAS